MNDVNRIITAVCCVLSEEGTFYCPSVPLLAFYSASDPCGLTQRGLQKHIRNEPLFGNVEGSTAAVVSISTALKVFECSSSSEMTSASFFFFFFLKV